MNALNEVNKVITSVSYYTHRHSQLEEDEWLTAEKMAVSIVNYLSHPDSDTYMFDCRNELLF